jgi:hypothetical protein
MLSSFVHQEHAGTGKNRSGRGENKHKIENEAWDLQEDMHCRDFFSLTGTLLLSMAAPFFGTHDYGNEMRVSPGFNELLLKVLWLCPYFLPFEDVC